MGAVAAVTAGLLLLAGVGDGESRLGGAWESRDQRIKRATERLAVDIVQQIPEICDSIDRSSEGTNGLAIAGDPSYFAGLSETEMRDVSRRLIGELRLQCGEGGR